MRKISGGWNNYKVTKRGTINCDKVNIPSHGTLLDENVLPDYVKFENCKMFRVPSSTLKSWNGFPKKVENLLVSGQWLTLEGMPLATKVCCIYNTYINNFDGLNIGDELEILFIKDTNISNMNLFYDLVKSLPKSVKLVEFQRNTVKVKGEFLRKLRELRPDINIIGDE